MGPVAVYLIEVAACGVAPRLPAGIFIADLGGRAEQSCHQGDIPICCEDTAESRDRAS